MNPTDVELARRATPGCANRVHLNNCGASLPAAEVTDAVIDHIQLEQAIGPYEAAAEHVEEAKRLYDAAAALVGSTPEEIAFCDSASRAWNLMVYSLDVGPGDKILTSTIEFGSGLVALQHVAERTGAEVVVGPSDRFGRLDLDQLSEVDLGGTRVVAVTHVAAHSGVANPVVEIGHMARELGATYIVDACQSVGSIPVDVSEIGCDALTATGRKWLRGPRGTGFLYVADALSRAIDPTSSDLVTADYLFEPDERTSSRLKFRDDARKFELWERNIAAAIGLGVAISAVLDLGIEEIHRRVLQLADLARAELSDISGIDVWSPSTSESGIVGFTMESLEPAQVKELCAAANINVSTMADWDAPIDFRRRDRTSVVRVAPHYYNIESEIEQFISVIRGAAR